MPSNFSTKTSDLSLEEIREGFQSGPKLLVCGHEFSEEDRIPQFDGILKGVWSGVPRNVDPFTNLTGRKMVMGWFGWRMNLISRVSHERHFASCEKLISALGVEVVATQTVDGQLLRTGLTEAIELFGNLFRGRCIECGAPYPILTESDFQPGKQPTCSLCQGTVFPDVAMFGWNHQQDARERFASTIQATNVVISFGADIELTPELSPEAFRHSHQILLQILPERIAVHGKNGAKFATVHTIARMVEAATGQHLQPPSAPSYRGVAEFLALVAEAIT